MQRIYGGSRLLALDEPTSALDLHHQLAALEAVRAHVRDTGAGALVALHDLTLAARYCDHIVLLADQRMISHDTSAVALSEEHVSNYWQIAPEFPSDRENHRVVVPHALK